MMLKRLKVPLWHTCFQFYNSFRKREKLEEIIIKINTTTKAFGDTGHDNRLETARILKILARELEDNQQPTKLVDLDGLIVGEAQYKIRDRSSESGTSNEDLIKILYKTPNLLKDCTNDFIKHQQEYLDEIMAPIIGSLNICTVDINKPIQLEIEDKQLFIQGLRQMEDQHRLLSDEQLLVLEMAETTHAESASIDPLVDILENILTNILTERNTSDTKTIEKYFTDFYYDHIFKA